MTGGLMRSGCMVGQTLLGAIVRCLAITTLNGCLDFVARIASNAIRPQRIHTAVVVTVIRASTRVCGYWLASAGGNWFVRLFAFESVRSIGGRW
jgi:hypothetical protein